MPRRTRVGCTSPPLSLARALHLTGGTFKHGTARSLVGCGSVPRESWILYDGWTHGLVLDGGLCQVPWKDQLCFT